MSASVYFSRISLAIAPTSGSTVDESKRSIWRGVI